MAKNKSTKISLKILEIEKKTNKDNQLFTPWLNKKIEKWVVINTGKLFIDLTKGTYKFSSLLIPAKIFEINNLGEDYPYTLRVNFVGMYFYLVIPGRILSLKLTPIDFIKQRLVIEFTNFGGIENTKQLKNFIYSNPNSNQEKHIIPNLALKSQYKKLIINLEDSFYLKIELESNKKVFIPSTEIARHYMLGGKVLSNDLVIYSKYLPVHFIIARDIETNEKVYFSKFDPNLTHAEIRFLALVTASSFAKKASELTFTRLIEEEYRIIKNDKSEKVKILKAFIPFEGRIKIGATGFYVDHNEENFIVTQIHQTVENNPFFDRIDYLPIIDYRSIADKKKRQELELKKSKKSVAFSHNKPNKKGSEVDIVPNPPNSLSLNHTLQDDLMFIDFFDKNEIQVIKREKVDQEFRYDSNYNVYSKNGSEYSSEPSTSDKTSDVASLAEVIFNKEAISAFKPLIEACKKLSADPLFSVEYLDFANQELSPTIPDHINNLRNSKLIIIRVIYKNMFYFYFIDICYESKSDPHYIGLFYENQLGDLTYSIIEQIIDCKIETGKSWGELKKEEIITSVNVIQFNRSGGEDALKIRIKDEIDYISKKIK